MYECKDCKAEFETPVIDYETRDERCRPVTYCPKCMSLNISYIESYYCAFCGAVRVAKGEVYCSDSCRRFGEEIERRMAERRAKIKDFEVTKAVAEVEEYNRTHGTKYSYGQYFALKGMGELDDN